VPATTRVGLPKSEEAEHRDDNHDETHEINDVVHRNAPLSWRDDSQTGVERANFWVVASISGV
jgi:hypothetical protein